MTMTTPPLRWLRDAVARKALADHMSHYHLSSRMAAATDGTITAAHPLPMDVPTCLVKGEHIEAASRALDGAPQFFIENNQLLIRGGRSRVRVPVVEQDLWTPTPLEGEWRPVPRDLTAVLRDLLPFVADGTDNTSWLGCVAIAEDGLWATNKKMMARSRVPIDAAGTNILLARNTVEWIVDREDGLTEWCLTEHSVGFRWENGAWMRSSLVTGQWPLVQGRALVRDDTQELSNFPITDEWKASLERLIAAASAANGGLVELRNSSLNAEGGGLFVEIDAENMLPEGLESTWWGAKELATMAGVAQSWNPAPPPDIVNGQPKQRAAPFAAQRIIGVISRANPPGAT